MDFTKESQTIISICSGIRGLEKGLQLAGIKFSVAAFLEVEAFAIANLVTGMEAGMVDPAPVWTDVKTFDARPFCGKIHGIIGGYPCTPFSSAGKRQGAEDKRHLYPYIESIIKATRPLWCFFENVDDHLSLGYDYVQKSLYDLGYRTEAGVYTAFEAGASHERKRLFILAVINGIQLNWPRSWEQGWWNEFADQGAMANPGGNGYIATENSNKCSTRERRDTPGQNAMEQFAGCSHERIDDELADPEIINGGLPIPGRQQEQESAEPFGAGEAVANANQVAAGRGFGIIQETHGQTEIDRLQWERGGDGSINGGEKLVNTDSKGCEGATWAEQPGFDKQVEQPATQGNGSTTNGNDTTGAELADTDNSGSEQDRQQTKLWAGGFEQPPFNSWSSNERENYKRGFHGWPAGPGEPQHHWEEPRTISSRFALPNDIRQMGKRLWKDYKEILSKEERQTIEAAQYPAVESALGLSTHGYDFRDDFLRALGNAVVPWQSATAIVDLVRKHVDNNKYQ